MTKTNHSTQAAAILGTLTLAASAFAGTTVTTGKVPAAPAPAPAAEIPVVPVTYYAFHNYFPDLQR